MKQLLAVLSLAVATMLFAADEKAASPVMPDEITLTSGRVLRRIEVQRWEKERVIVKHVGGTEALPFAVIKAPARELLVAVRDNWTKDPKKAATVAKASATPAGTDAAHYEGQAFIVTRGAGNYKLGGMTVRIYFKPEEEMREKFKWSSQLPAPDATAVTDADGKFSFTGPAAGNVTVVAKASRLTGRNSERYLWITSVSDWPSRLTPFLTNNNLEPEPYVQSGAYEAL